MRASIVVALLSVVIAAGGLMPPERGTGGERSHELVGPAGRGPVLASAPLVRVAPAPRLAPFLLPGGFAPGLATPTFAVLTLPSLRHLQLGRGPGRPHGARAPPVELSS